jgi:polysaccharide biosynthesis protein PelD
VSFSRLVMPRVALLDAMVLAAILVSLNCWVAPTDPGWLKVNPSPYILLPILIGGRFGFLPGMGAGILSVVIITAGQFWVKKVDPVSSLSSERYIYSCLVLTGGICGELQHFFNGRLKRLTEIQSTFEQRIKKLDNELYFLREAKVEVDRIIATHDSGLSTLDTEIRELYLINDEQFYQQVLALLNRQAHVADAAIYLIQPNRQLVRQAVMGTEHFLPRELALSEVEMALLAIERKTAVSISEFWKLGATRPEPYLICLPFLDADDNPVAVLMITGMPFFSLNQQAVHLITVICKWASRIIQVKKTADGSFRLVDGVQKQKIFTEKILRRNLELASVSHQIHHLPSTLVFFSLPGMALTLQSALERAVITCVRAGDFAAQLDFGFPNLAVLLPLTGERIAQQSVRAALAQLNQDAELAGSVEHRMFTLDESENGEQLWQELLDHANATRGPAG